MVNYIWGIFIIIGICYSLFTGSINSVNEVILKSGSDALNMIMGIFPLMCLWLGIMNIAKKSGLLNIISNKMKPILKLIFPEIPTNHESMDFIASNIVVNMVGLGNAATPFGLKAMKSLQELNNKKDTASRSMITFLIINTSSVTIIPTTVITLRLLYNSVNPTEILTASIITTFLSTFIGLIIDRIFYLLRRNT